MAKQPTGHGLIAVQEYLFPCYEPYRGHGENPAWRKRNPSDSPHQATLLVEGPGKDGFQLPIIED